MSGLSPPPPVGAREGAPTRRALLASGAVFAATLTACSDLLSRTELASHLLVDPALDAYRPILDALAATILPLEEERFPIRAPERITTRVLELFPLEAERRFLGLQKTLLLFDTLALFPRTEGPIEAVERERMTAFGAPDRAGVAEELAAKRRREGDAWSVFESRFAPHPPRFTALPVAERRAYFALWGESEFLLRREFRSATRALLFSAVYSLDEVWAAIGYAGPLVEPGAPRASAG